MDLKISKQNLTKLLARAASASAAKSPIAILSSIVLRADADGSVTAIGSDLVMSVTATAQAAVKRPGEVAVVARQFVDVTKSLPAGDVHIALNKDGSRVELKAGKSRFKLPFASTEDFPAIPSAENAKNSLTMSSADLGRVIAQCGYAMSTDESREFICCVRLESEADNIVAIAADGHRVAVSRAPCADSDLSPVHVGGKAISELKKTCGEFAGEDVKVCASGAYAFFVWPTVTLCTKLVDSQFIPWRKVFPSSHKTTVTVRRQSLVDGLKRASTVVDSRDASVKISVVSDSIEISCESASNGAAFEDVDAIVRGPEVEFHINPNYFIEAASSLVDDELEVRIIGDKDPVVVAGTASPDECISLTLPMRG